MSACGFALNASMRSGIRFMGDLVVDWKSAYKREEHASWEDIARMIDESVTMGEAVRMYVPECEPKHKRIPCPIHSGKDYNFSFTDHGFKCFVCGAGGDVIAFVKEVCELPTRADAMRRINEDFRLNLPIGRGISPADKTAMNQRREAAEAKRRAKKEWEAGLCALWDEWCRLDKQKRLCKPGTKEHIEAIKNIDRVSFEIDNYPAEPG